MRDNLLRGLDARGRRPPRIVRDPGSLGTLLVAAREPARLDRLLALAGRPAAWPLSRVLLAKLVLAIVAGRRSACSCCPARATASLVVMVLAVVVTAYFVPELLLYSRGQERQDAIALELPDTLDQMTIAVEAGSASSRRWRAPGKNGKGPLAEELVRTLQDIAVGQSRREAYQALADRTGVPDLRAVRPRGRPGRHLRHLGRRRAAHPGEGDAHSSAGSGPRRRRCRSR